MLFSNKMLLASTILTMPGDVDTANGGYRAYNNFGDGMLYNLNVAAKSVEVSRAWNGQRATLQSAFSRVSGDFDTTKVAGGTDFGGDISNNAQIYADQLVFGGQTDWYLGAIDELQAIYSKLRPGVTTVPVFQSGGSQEYPNSNAWSSTETDASTAMAMGILGGTSSPAKSTSYPIRPIRRFLASAPYPIGTAMEGGYLAAYFTDLSSGAPLTYMLIVADKSTEVTRAYQTSTVGLGGIYLSRTNGSAPTEVNSGANGAAFTYCYNLVSGTKTDWYLPAIDELLAIYRLNANLPTGQNLDANSYWTSTEIDSTTALRVTSAGIQQIASKTGTNLVRAVRRVLLP